MKSLKFEDLRGTNTVISCPTQEEAIQVEKICNFKDRANNWKHYRENFCINLEEDGEWSSIDYYEDNGYAIIPAADFIAANTEQAPDLSGTRPAVEWLEFLPEPYRGKALEAVKVAPNEPNRICSYQNCINYAIDWANTNEDSDFWIAINAHLQDPSNPLPPLPSEGVEKEKVEAETDIQKLTKATMIKFAEQEKRLELMVDLHDKLQGKVESLEKQLIAKTDTAEPAISQTPAEPEVKLPVTIEDVWEEEEEMRGRVSFWATNGLQIKEDSFCGAKIITEFRKESNCKKDRAFSMLLKISEAQNEIAPREGNVWYAYIQFGKLKIGRTDVTTLGQPYFHSEQGLKDCIEANRELWMDLLKGE